MFSSKGTLSYRGNWSLRLEVDQQIADYYRKLIPKYKNINGLRYPAHITIVREKNGLEYDRPTDMSNWGQYEGETVEFFYDGIIREGEVYFWINAFSKRFEEIRTELGLSCEENFSIPPEGFQKTFHMSIANKRKN